jgi:hypothetical protein
MEALMRDGWKVDGTGERASTRGRKYPAWPAPGTAKSLISLDVARIFAKIPCISLQILHPVCISFLNSN